MNHVITLSTFLFALSLVTSTVQAEGEKLRSKLSKGTLTISAEVKGCDADAKKYCPGLEPGTQKSFLCLMAYEDNLSESCKLGIVEAAMAIRMGAAAINYSVSACEADADKYCLDVKPGEGRLVNCIKKNQNNVSNACITALKETGLWNIGTK